MHRLMVAVALAFAIAPIHSALAEIEVVKVTPEYLKENDQIRVVTALDGTLATFKIRLRLTGPQHVTMRLVTTVNNEEEELLATANVVTESETEMRFTLRKAAIKGATFYLGVGGYDLKEGVAKPWLGGTSYMIHLVDFVQSPLAPDAEKDSGRNGGTDPLARKPLAPAADPAADGFGGGAPALAPAPAADPFAGGAPAPARAPITQKSSVPLKSGSITNPPTDPFAKGDRLSIEQADKVVLETIAAKTLVEVHGFEDSIDTSRTIKFLGKAGGVEVRPGSSVLVELPRPTKEFAWHAGDALEGVGDSELPAAFTHVWCRWQADGKLTWKCYGPR